MVSSFANLPKQCIDSLDLDPPYPPHLPKLLLCPLPRHPCPRSNAQEQRQRATPCRVVLPGRHCRTVTSSPHLALAYEHRGATKLIANRLSHVLLLLFLLLFCRLPTLESPPHLHHHHSKQHNKPQRHAAHHRHRLSQARRKFPIPTAPKQHQQQQ